MKRLAYKLYRIATWARYWFPRRFTPAGFLVLMLLLASAALGLDMEQTVAYQSFALLLGLLVVSFVAGWLFRGKFRVQRHLPRFATAGLPLRYRVEVHNANSWTAHNLEWLEELADPRPSFEEFIRLRRSPRSMARWLAGIRETWRRSSMDQAMAREFRRFGYGRQQGPRSVPVAAVPPSESGEAWVEFVPRRRGRLEFTGVTVGRSDPFGVFRGFLNYRLHHQLLVLPKRYPLPGLVLPGSRTYQRGGVAYASTIGESDEFASLRDYRIGDPLRHIHWRSWARTGRPIVKEFLDEHFSRHALILDTLPMGDWNEDGGEIEVAEEDPVFEEAVSVAASFACAVDTQESLLDLMFVGPRAICLTVGRGVGHSQQALELLASARLTRDRTVTDLERLVLAHAQNLCGCICIFRGLDPAREQLISRLECMSLPVLIFVITENFAERAPDRVAATVGGNTIHYLQVGRIEDSLNGLALGGGG